MHWVMWLGIMGLPLLGFLTSDPHLLIHEMGMVPLGRFVWG